MGIMVYSLLWVMQDFVHQPKDRGPLKGLGFRVFLAKSHDPSNRLQQSFIDPLKEPPP